MSPGSAYGDLVIASGVNLAALSLVRVRLSVVLLKTQGCGGDLRAILAGARVCDLAHS